MDRTNDVLSLFSNEKIYHPKEITGNEGWNIQDTLSAKKAIYIIESNTGIELNEEFKTLIAKMNMAINYTDEDLLILYHAGIGSISFELLREQFDCELVILFGNFYNSATAQMQLSSNKIYLLNALKVIQTDSIEIIHSDQNAKALFWNILKTLR